MNPLLPKDSAIFDYSWQAPADDKKTTRLPIFCKFLLLCIFAIIFRYTIMVRQRATTVDFSAVDTHAAFDITVVGLTALILIFSGSLGHTWSKFRHTPFVWLFGYYLICAFSSIWSSAPAYSLYRAVEYLILCFATLTIIAHFHDFERAETGFFIIAIATIIFQMMVNVRLVGFSFSLSHWHTNTYSASSAILFCYCFGEYFAMTKAERAAAKARTKRLLRAGIFSFGTLALGTSSASNVAAAVGCLMIFLSLRRFGLLLLGLWVGFIFFLLGGGPEIIMGILFPGKDEYALETASGRTLIWELYWYKFLQRPLLGHGFGVISSGRDAAFAARSHNSLFTVLIGTGLIGLLFFAIFSIRLWWDALISVWRRIPGTVGFTGALAAAFVNSLGMPLMADRWVTTSIVFVWLLGLFVFYIHGDRQQTGPPEYDMIEKECWLC